MLHVEVHKMRFQEDFPKITLNKIISIQMEKQGLTVAQYYSTCSHKLSSKVLGSIPRTKRKKL